MLIRFVFGKIFDLFLFIYFNSVFNVFMLFGLSDYFVVIFEINLKFYCFIKFFYKVYVYKKVNFDSLNDFILKLLDFFVLNLWGNLVE